MLTFTIRNISTELFVTKYDPISTKMFEIFLISLNVSEKYEFQIEPRKKILYILFILCCTFFIQILIITILYYMAFDHNLWKFLLCKGPLIFCISCSIISIFRMGLKNNIMYTSLSQRTLRVAIKVNHVHWSFLFFLVFFKYHKQY